MEWGREVPETREEARKAEENGFLGDGMNEVGKGLGIPTPPFLLITKGPDYFVLNTPKITFY